MSDDAFARRLTALRAEIDGRLAALLPSSGAPAVLHEAAAYALLSPGKRLRPALAVLAAEHFGPRAGLPAAARRAALDAGCAVEMVHAASLVLDDLPCMDAAALRRGRPTVHRAFGEDVAVLAAVGLMNQAFAVVCGLEDAPAAARAGLAMRLTRAIGFDGLVAGQVRDLRERAEGAPPQDLNRQKTGALFVAAVEAGAISAGAAPPALEAARAFGDSLGDAFQILDDLLDATSTPAAAGKDVRQDGSKPTVVSLAGPEAARTQMRLRLDDALGHLAGCGPGPLRRFAEGLFGAAAAAA